MGNGSGYAVYFFPQALEALGEAIKPYLLDGPAGVHVLCHHVDTGGAFVEMTLHGKAHDDTALELELMVPSGMVRMVVSAHSDDAFGFGPRSAGAAGAKAAKAVGEDTGGGEQTDVAAGSATAK